MQALFGTSAASFSLPTPRSVNNFLNKVWEVVKKILFCLTAVIFFATSATAFTIGFAIGFVKSKKIQKIIGRIHLVWATQPWKVLLVTGVGAFLSLPVTWTAASFFTGAYIGSKLYYDAKALDKK